MLTRPGPPETTPFNGPQSLRVAHEWAVLFWSLAAMLAAAPILSVFFPILASVKEIALLVVGALVYVTLARGRLIGGSIRVHSGQFGHVHEVATECSRALRMGVPNIFVRDDPFVPIVAVGIGEPYSLIISAQWVDHLTPGEMRFLMGRELAHIQSGHTRVTSLLSVNGRENAFISVLFGAWLRRIEYTADRAGLLCCHSLEEALNAISVSTFHLIGRKIDVSAFAEQQRELEAERTLRMGEWTSATPYATKRIAALRAFARDALFLHWSARFNDARKTAYMAPAPPPPGAMPRKVFAAFPRRVAAWMIDATIIGVIAPKIPTFDVREVTSDTSVPAWGHGIARAAAHAHVINNFGGTETLAFVLYVVLIVGLTGQTFGMMILDLRVVTERFGTPGIARTAWRYTCLCASVIAVIGMLRIFGRIQPFEKWSGTRLIQVGAFVRNSARVRAPEFETASSA